MDYFLTYLILRLDEFSFVTASLSVIAFAAFIFLVIIHLSNNIDRESDRIILKKVKPWIKPAFVVFCVAVFLNAIVPTTKQAAVVYCLPKIVNNEQAKKMPDNLLKLANSWIDEAVSKVEKAIPEKPPDDTNSTTN
jgi:hypothetical protein